jgi:RimJ/RimL family protein N-acetyltransferase
MSNPDGLLPPVQISTYLDRLILRTPIPADFEPNAALLSSPEVMKHLTLKTPIGGWPPDRQKGIWLPSDVATRVAAREKERREGRACNVSCILKETGEYVGSSGFSRIQPVGTPGRQAELGIIFDTSTKFARKGYATEALHAATRHAFEQLEGIEMITIHTHYNNEEMRGWAEKVAGLEVNEVVEDGEGVWYRFTRAEWEEGGGVRDRLEARMDKWK